MLFLVSEKQQKLAKRREARERKPESETRAGQGEGGARPMTDLDELFGAQHRNLRASIEKAMQDRETRKVADRTAKLAARSAKRRKSREQRAARERQGAERGTR